jgi:hypothetical protein
VVIGSTAVDWGGVPFAGAFALCAAATLDSKTMSPRSALLLPTIMGRPVLTKDFQFGILRAR